MKRHSICVSIDVDPDGLAGMQTDRTAITWDGLKHSRDIGELLAIHDAALGGPAPLTWFVRIDGQLRTRYGSSCFLLDEFHDHWERETARGSELAWHPHLYREDVGGSRVRLIAEPAEACEELSALWEEIRRYPFAPCSFRNGEAWQSPETTDVIERLGVNCDSSAVPGLKGPLGHPMDWAGAPNEPYYPDKTDVRRPGPPRRLVELPMNTWPVQAPWDTAPRLRYMNPAVRHNLFREALDAWRHSILASPKNAFTWVLITHPDEIMDTGTEDGLIAHSRDDFLQNLAAMALMLGELGHAWEFVTVQEAARRWRCREETAS